jgi:hypothetical protein
MSHPEYSGGTRFWASGVGNLLTGSEKHSAAARAIIAAEIHPEILRYAGKVTTGEPSRAVKSATPAKGKK